MNQYVNLAYVLYLFIKYFPEHMFNDTCNHLITNDQTYILS